MEHHSGGRRVDNSASHEPRRSAPQKKNSKKRGGRVKTVLKVLGTLFLVGVLTVAIFMGIFLTYVKTVLAPDLVVNLDDSCQVSTSQPSAFDVGELWKKLLEEYDDIVCIPMSSGLSETCHTLAHLAETEFAGKVYVVDNKRISITQKSAVYDAIELAKQGKNKISGKGLC